MFLCRSGRLSAAALDRIFKSPGSFLVRDVTVTLRKGYAVQLHRCFCVSVGGVDATLVQLEKRQQPDRRLPLESRDSSRAVDRVHSDSRGHAEPTERVQREAYRRADGEQVGHGWFTGDWRGFGRLCAAGTMQTRSLSTTRRSDANNKEGEQNLKEASSTSSSTAKAPGEPEPEGGKPNKTQQLKKVFKEYGAVGVSFHIGISLMSLGMVYLLISSGIDMAAVLCKVGFSESVVRSKMAAGTSTFVLSYAIHKLFAPVRISITLVSVPLIVRYFRKTGHFKPPTPAP